MQTVMETKQRRDTAPESRVLNGFAKKSQSHSKRQGIKQHMKIPTKT